MYMFRGITPRTSLTRSVGLRALPLNRCSRLSVPHSKQFTFFSTTTTLAMDDNVKKHYLADSPPTVVRLEIKPHFESLQDEKLRKYAHYMSR